MSFQNKELFMINILTHLRTIHFIFHNLQCFSSQFSKLFMHTMQAASYRTWILINWFLQCFVDFSFLSFSVSLSTGLCQHYAVLFSCYCSTTRRSRVPSIFQIWNNLWKREFNIVNKQKTVTILTIKIGGLASVVNMCVFEIFNWKIDFKNVSFYTVDKHATNHMTVEYLFVMLWKKRGKFKHVWLL